MSGKESKKKKKAPEVLSWEQNKELCDKDEEDIKRDVYDMSSWARMMRAMDDNQLKEYVRNMPKDLQNGKTAKSLLGIKQKRKVKPRASSSSQGIMASVWKFDKEDDEEPSPEVPV